MITLMLAAALAGPPDMFRCNAAHTGVCAGAPAAPRVTLLWRFFTDRLNRSTPSYADGVVYVGSNNHLLYALDASNGQVRWTFRARGPVESTPAIRDGAVYVADDRAIYAIDAATGKMRWRRGFGADLPHPGSIWDWDFFQSSPTVAGARVYIGSGDGNLYALDADNGRVIWRYHTNGRVRSTPAVAGDTVYVGSFDGAVYAISATSGTLRWRFKTKGDRYFPIGEVQSSPAVADGVVYVGARDGYCYALDAKTGVVRWAHDEPQYWVSSSPAVADGRVYYGSSDGDALRALDARTGKLLWSFDVPGRVWSSPTIFGNLVYFGTGTGQAIWVNAQDGKPVGGSPSEGTIYSSVIVAHGTVFYTSDDGYIYAAR